MIVCEKRAEVSMQFSPQQDRALHLVHEWMKSDRQVFGLFGYAGTGKTTLAKYLKASFYAAYTGKAAYVLRDKGCRHASTIHSLIYNPRGKSEKRLMELILAQQESPTPGRRYEIERERENLNKPSFTLNLESVLRDARLLVIDECSMVNEQIGKDLESFGCKILVLGDPAQLPPVRGGGYFTNRQPDVLLTEIHRQARGNPILDLATIVRTTGGLPRDHELIYRGRPTETMVRSADQLIVGKNDTRFLSNKRMRELLGYTGNFPQPGERVVCLRNNHQLGILNGGLFKVLDSTLWGDVIDMRLEDESTKLPVDVQAHIGPFIGEEVDYYVARDYESFDYGYALTCHKSQGSQWDSVGVFDESGAFNRGGNAGRWLYTAVTRAAKELWVAS